MKPIITFDFDDTLQTEEYQNTGWFLMGSGKSKPIEKIINFLMEKYKEGHECHIVTFRNKWDMEEVHQFVTRYNLPIKREHIHYTSGKSKTPKLKELNSILHLDDNVQVCILAEQEGIPCLLVDHGWNTDENSTAELLNKICVKK